MLVLVLVLAAATLAGCGERSPSPRDEQQVKATLRAFLVAVAEGDGASACADVTAAGRARLAAAAAQRDVPCARVVAGASRALSPVVRLALRSASVRRVQIRGDRATVAAGDIASTGGSLQALLGGGGASTNFRKVGGRWLVDG